MINLGYQIIDLHAHLRDKIPFHTKLAKEAGIGTVLYMANTQPCLDNLKAIKQSLEVKRYLKAIPVSAITIGRKGKKLVDIDKIKPYVAGFSDDGDCLKNLKFFEQALKKNVLLMVHSEPEAEMIKKYLSVLVKVGGRLHLQHVASARAVEIIRQAKKSGLKFTAETCPHYFIYPRKVEDKPIYPPLGTFQDIKEIKRGLADGTIDCIASDYAPIPRPKGTGFASFGSFIPLCYSLVLEKVLTPRQLKEKIHDNPLKILSP